MNLLIADDNARVRQVIKEVLKDLTTEIHECADGAEAVSDYALHRPDWVLMDIGMPVCDGIAATRLIKSNFPEAKIVIVTAHNHRDLRKAAIEAGACAYVLKDDLADVRTILTDGGKSMETEAIRKAATSIRKTD